MDVVIIGAGATGLKAASRIKRRDPEVNVTVIESGKFISIAKCGLPYLVGGFVNELNDLRKTTYGIVRDEQFFKKLKDVEILTSTKADSIDRGRKVVKIVKSDGSEDELNYDFLVIATGAKPIKPEIEGIDSEGVFQISNPEHAEAILDYWESEEPENAVVIGSSPMGIETCEALTNLGIEVTLIEPQDHLVPGVLDEDIAKLLENHLKAKGVKILTSTNVSKIITKNGKVSAVQAGKEIETKMVILAIGSKPNVELAKNAGLKIGETGAISVNEFLQTSDSNIFAGGDCVENLNVITGKYVYFPSGSIANKHGRIIGDNITGGKEKFPGIIGSIIFKAFDFTVAKVGLSEKEAIENGFDVLVTIAPSPDRCHFYPKMNNLRLKIIVDKKTNKIIGAQAAGMGVIDKRIDVLATAIQAGLTIDQLSYLDLPHSPPYSAEMDNVIVLANVARNKRDGLLETTRAHELRELVDRDDVLILDVRNRDEFEKGVKIEAKNVINIPILELRDRINEIPKDKKIIVVCPLGARSYEAYRILKANGFKDVKTLEGGLALWT